MICSIFMALRAIYFQAILLRDPVSIAFQPRHEQQLKRTACKSSTCHDLSPDLETWRREKVKTLAVSGVRYEITRRS